MSLNDIREQINNIDDKILKLLIKRMECSKEVAEIKINKNLPVLNAKREDEVLERISKLSFNYSDMFKQIFASIMQASRLLQYKILNNKKDVNQLINRIEHNSLLNKKIPIIACQGIKGSYSEEAAKLIFPESKINFTEDFETAFELIKYDNVDFAVLPIENSSAGSVIDVYDLILKYRFFIVKGINLKISHCLAGIADSSIKDIKTVISHQQALSQSSEFIKKNKLKTQDYINTAAAAKMVFEKNDRTLAAICSTSAAKRYNLKILESNIQNNDDNYTRFVVMSKRAIIEENADKISICFSLPHKTGSLYNILGIFSMAGLNLTKIESRPIPEEKFRYYFNLDFSGCVKSKELVNILYSLSKELPDFSFLGNYNDI